MVWRALTFIPTAAIALVLASCATTPEVKPKARVVVPLHEGSTRTRISVHLLDEVVLQLPPITQPGMQWTIVYNDERYLQPLHPIQPAANGGYTTSFLAMRQGRRLVRMFALPATTGREAVPTQTYEVLIEIE